MIDYQKAISRLPVIFESCKTKEQVIVACRYARLIPYSVRYIHQFISHYSALFGLYDFNKQNNNENRG